MNVQVPSKWSERGGGTGNKYSIAENDNGVVVGYKIVGPKKYSVWAGEGTWDSKTVKAKCTSEREAKMKALEFMEKYPGARYVSKPGIGVLKDVDGKRVSRI